MINMKRNFLSDVRWILLALAMGLISVVGCAPIETNPDGVEPGVDTPATTIPPTEAVAPVEDVEEPTPTPGTRTDFPTGEVPQSLFDLVLDDVLAVTGGARADVEVIKAEAVTWNDGAMGCPQPDMMYTQALVPGYQVIFSVGGKTFDYHLSDRGGYLLCENKLPSIGAGGTPTK
jgi:hypothetical protein